MTWQIVDGCLSVGQTLFSEMYLDRSNSFICFLLFFLHQFCLSVFGTKKRNNKIMMMIKQTGNAQNSNKFLNPENDEEKNSAFVYALK